MTDDATRAHLLLAPLRERPVSVDSARAEGRRARIVPQLRRHLVSLAGRRRRMRRVRIAAFALAAVAFVAVIVGYGAMHHAVAVKVAEIRAVQGHLLHRISGEEHTVLAGDRLAVPVAGELRTDGSSGASLETESGLRLDLETSSEVSLSELSAPGGDRSVELIAGQLGCKVPKLEPGSSFAVVTPNARVVVHGTKFTVRVDSSEAGVTRTCVRVREGLVAVHHTAGRTMLHAGESWGCAEEPKPVALNIPLPPPLPLPPRLAVRHAAARELPAARAAREGTLARETELLQSALAAERGGRRAAAVASLTELLSAYPESPLLPEARSALKRIASNPAP